MSYKFTWYMPLVVGQKESENKSVNVRSRNNQVYGEQSIARVIERFGELTKSKSTEDNF